MWDWINNKLWFEKLFDVGLGLLILIALVAIIITALKILKKVGTPVVSTDGKKVTFKLLDLETGVEKEVSTDDFVSLIHEKDKQINVLTCKLQEVQDKLVLLEFELQKHSLIIDYQKAHAVPMSEHTVFFNLKRNIEGGINLDCDTTESLTKIKQEVAKAYIEECKMTVFYKRLKEYVLGFEEIGSDGEKLGRLYTIVSKLYDWIEEYSIVALNKHVKLSDGREFYGIPKSFINKFNDWHTPHVEIVVKKIKEVLYNEFYGTWQLKLIVILDHIDTAFYLTIQDAEKTIQSINGGVEKDIQQKLNNLI